MHHFHMLHFKQESKTVPNKVVLAMAPGRCRWSAVGATRSEMVLLITLKIVLLKNGVLKLIPIVQTKISEHKRMNMKLSKYSVAHASWSSSKCSSSECCLSSSRCRS